MANLLQSARADAVRALLVFLDLLKGDAERIAQMRLTHIQHHTAYTTPTADRLVYRIGRFSTSHRLLSQEAEHRSNHLTALVQPRLQQGSGHVDLHSNLLRGRAPLREVFPNLLAGLVPTHLIFYQAFEICQRAMTVRRVNGKRCASVAEAPGNQVLARHDYVS